jgi:hypothetical protein
LNKSVEYISYEMPIQKMDTLDRQLGKKFHDWAKHIQELAEFYKFYVSYPSSHQVIKYFIYYLKLKMQQLDIYNSGLHSCGQYIDYRHNYIQCVKKKIAQIKIHISQ